MDDLEDTPWDVVISGTGLQQSLLALALSRSGKRILHVDSNKYYGDQEAAFSLQEVDDWIKQVRASDHWENPSLFSNPSLWKKDTSDSADTAQLSFSRAYTLSLSPQIIYGHSKLLKQMVSSKIYKQLEFLAVVDWWLYEVEDGQCQLKCLPSIREHITFDRSIDVRTKRNLFRFIKCVFSDADKPELWLRHAQSPLSEYMSTEFGLPPRIQTYLLALTMSLDLPSSITVEYALPRIFRHLFSHGELGPGIRAVIPKWGGGSEIAQVACRASAVGGAVYMLDKRIHAIKDNTDPLTVRFDEDEVKSSFVVETPILNGPDDGPQVVKSITIVSTGLLGLFPTREGIQSPAASVVTFPSGSLVVEDERQQYPVYILTHSSATGECPAGQCVLYASTMKDRHAEARLRLAVSELLKTVANSSETSTDAAPEELYRLTYTQEYVIQTSRQYEGTVLKPTGMDLAFDDSMLDSVEDVWRKIVGPEADSFMTFEDREGTGDDDYDEEDA